MISNGAYGIGSQQEAALLTIPFEHYQTESHTGRPITPV